MSSLQDRRRKSHAVMKLARVINVYNLINALCQFTGWCFLLCLTLFSNIFGQTLWWYRQAAEFGSQVMHCVYRGENPIWIGLWSQFTLGKLVCWAQVLAATFLALQVPGCMRYVLEVCELPFHCRASFALSYKRLEPGYQQCGRYLANFPGSFDYKAATAILPGDSELGHVNANTVFVNL